MLHKHKILFFSLILFNAINSIEVFNINFNKNIYKPNSTEQILELFNKSINLNKKIAVIGHDKSQGGQTTSSSKDSIRISLENYNKLLDINISKKEVTVQAGMTWKQLQKIISSHKLSITAMQSFNDFSIGGSLSVNVHGQDINENPLIKNVKSFKLLTSDGKIHFVDRSNELFGLVVGGYGLFGIILEVTLHLTDDVILNKNCVEIAATELPQYFFNHIKNNKKVQFYSARFSIGSSDLLQKALVISFEQTDKNNEDIFDFIKNNKNKAVKLGLIYLSKISFLKNYRLKLEKMIESKNIPISRNNFLNNTIKSLPRDTKDERFILQEYFIPYLNLNNFLDKLKNIIKDYKINILNITARHVNPNNESMLTYSPQECCAIVLYLSIKNNEYSYNKTCDWTKQLINYALQNNGTFYLPYHLIANTKQIQQAYPKFQEFMRLKKYYDPNEIFSNCLYEKYKS